MASKAQPVAAAAEAPLQMRLILSGPYIAQNLSLDEATAAAAVTDAWGVDYADAAYDPYNVPYGSGSSVGLPQSYQDFLTSLNPVETPPVPPAPDVAPTLDELVPSTVELGAADITLHILGEGFTPTSVIYFAGQPEPIVFVSDEEITTGVKPSLGWGAVTVPVLVKNGDQSSAALDFTFTEPLE